MMQTNTVNHVAVFAVAIVLLIATFSNIAHAQLPLHSTSSLPGNQTVGGGGITNPLGSADSITDVLKSVINWMLGLVGFLALIALIIGGGRMIINFGNEDQVKKAKTTIMWAVVGLAVVILSYAIINIVTRDILGGASSGSPQGNVEDPSPSDRLP